MTMATTQITRMTNSRQTGFSLFELIVYMLISSIMFAAAFNRYQAYPAEAERANFIAIVNQLKTGVNLRMVVVVAGGDARERLELAGSNPMDLMLQTPSNYLGAFDAVDESQLPRRSWYFDNTRDELVYLADRSDNLYALAPQGRIPTNRVRLHIVDIFADAEARVRWQGVALESVEPFEWLSTPLEMIEPTEESPPVMDEGLVELVNAQL